MKKQLYYPLVISATGTEVYPVLGEEDHGMPYVFDFSADNPDVDTYDTLNYVKFQEQIQFELERSGKKWGIGRYLEKRDGILRSFPQMMDQKRFYHVGLDVVVGELVPLHAPIDGTVYQIGFDSGQGNYGRYLILRHQISGVVFYSFYGHLDAKIPLQQGDKVLSGQIIAYTGKEEDSGGWFSHLHLQILTERAVHEGLIHTGYVDQDFLSQINDYFPSPYTLLAY